MKNTRNALTGMPHFPAPPELLNKSEKALVTAVAKVLTALFREAAGTANAVEFEIAPEVSLIPANTPTVQAAHWRTKIPHNPDPVPHLLGSSPAATEAFAAASSILSTLAVGKPNIRNEQNEQIVQRAIAKAAQDAGVPIHAPQRNQEVCTVA